MNYVIIYEYYIIYEYVLLFSIILNKVKAIYWFKYGRVCEKLNRNMGTNGLKKLFSKIFSLSMKILAFLVKLIYLLKQKKAAHKSPKSSNYYLRDIHLHQSYAMLSQHILRNIEAVEKNLAHNEVQKSVPIRKTNYKGICIRIKTFRYAVIKCNFFLYPSFYFILFFKLL